MVRLGISDMLFGGVERKIAIIGTLIIMVLVVIALRLPADQPVYVAGGQEANTIDVSGQGIVYADPDKATILFGYEVQKAGAAESQKGSANVMGAIKAALVSKGIPEEKIETSQYLVEPIRKYDEKEGTYEVVGYKTTHLLKVDIYSTGSGSFDNLGKYIDAAVSAGANRVDSVTFGFTEQVESKLKKDALVLASTRARESAQSVADGMNVKLKKLRSASESFYVVPYSYNLKMASDQAQAETQINPGQLSVQATVSARFEFG